MVLYYLSFAVGLAVAAAMSAFCAVKTGLRSADGVKYTVVGFAAALPGAVLMAIIYNAVLSHVAGGGAFSASRVSLYGGLLFMPLFLFVPVKLMKLDFGAITDICTPGVYALLGCAKLGCFLYGCCFGVESEHGVVNPLNGMTVFPVQLLESGLNFVIAFVLLIYVIKCRKTVGCAYPLGLVMYGTVRFFVQFLRYHELEAEKELFLHMDLWQTVSVFAVLAGALWLALTVRRQKKLGVRSDDA